MDSHRTLRQMFVKRIIVEFIREYAKSKWYDERNERSVALCEKFLAVIDNGDFELPLL